MIILIAALQVVMVAAGSFAVLAFLVSNLRYRKMQLEVQEEAATRMSPSGAALLVLEAVREKPVGALRIETEAPERGEEIRFLLQKHVRKEDQVRLLQSGVHLVLVDCPEYSLPRVASRIVAILKSHGVDKGTLAMSMPELNTESIFTWIQRGNSTNPVRNQRGGWTVLPENGPSEEEEAATTSPSVDPLTGVLRPDRVSRAVRRLLATHRRVGTEMSLIRVNVDQLDEVNQRVGREAGDRVLKRVADELMASCRETDLIGRVEEDEFVLCLPATSKQSVLAARRMSEKVKDATLKVGDKEIHFSAGFGIATMPVVGRNPTILFVRAGWA
ncbi:MAG: GGDEF domain-containing protein, partial [Kiritimatiellae bacterium]|nr:GGDEF domain-containing protein [Kiritimatiellia bacterium]